MQAEMEFATNYPILQVLDESFMGLEMGLGNINIWIDPDNLEAGNFEAAFSTFSCT